MLYQYRVSSLKSHILSQDIVHIYKGHIPLSAIYMHHGQILFQSKKDTKIEFNPGFYFIDEVKNQKKYPYDVLILKDSKISIIDKSLILSNKADKL